MIKFTDRIMSLMVSSTRPVQAIMAWAGVAASISLLFADLNNTWTPFDQLIDLISPAAVIALFIMYFVLSLYSCIWNNLLQPYKILKYVACSIGILLWTVAIASSFQYTPDGATMLHSMSFMYLIPLLADTWVLIQLIANVEKIERRGSGVLR